MEHTWEIVYMVVKAGAVAIFGGIAYYIKLIAASIKQMEKDINDIKVFAELSKQHNANMQHCIDELNRWKEKTEDGVKEFWRKYGSKLDEL